MVKLLLSPGVANHLSRVKDDVYLQLKTVFLVPYNAKPFP